MNQDKSCESLAVVVLLTEPKYHVIIPENYIHGLDELQHQLKTWGVNKKHDHLIFWKRSFLDHNVAPDSIEKANFSLEPRNDYPPPTNIFSACYKARVKRFFSKCCKLYLHNKFIRERFHFQCIQTDSFEDAKHFRDQFRPLLPVDYFGLDVNQPIPANFVNVNADPVVASTNNLEAKPMLVMEEMDEHDAMAINELMVEENWIVDGEQSDIETEEIELAAQTDDADDFNELASNSDNNGSNIAHDTENNPSNTGFESLILQEQADHGSVEENDPLELSERANSTNEFENNDSSIAVAEANTDEHDHLRNDERNTVTEIIDEDIEITFDLRQKLLPKVQSIPMVPKINDSLSGNIPYQAILDRNDVRLISLLIF